jgi:hypothetical protein
MAYHFEVCFDLVINDVGKRGRLNSRYYFKSKNVFSVKLLSQLDTFGLKIKGCFLHLQIIVNNKFDSTSGNYQLSVAKRFSIMIYINLFKPE